MTEPDYCRAIERILDYIGAGDTYQVNYTFKLSFNFAGSIPRFYRALRFSQPVPYGCILRNEDSYVLSFSPELFFRADADRIIARPMKGTAPRGRWSEEDQAFLAGLLASEKERAENVMIVDLIRNDLGRIAQFGTVEVEELFAAEQYETLYQLVATVSADLRPGTTTLDLFRALFPCGSVTGAPKVRTMEIIAELERDPRGVYCGAIGMLAPSGWDAPEASFSVAIRTVTIDRVERIASYGVGGGVTHDSHIEQEYAETRTKARVLVRKATDFTLIETMRWDPGSGYWFLDEHLDRLEASAGYCGYGFQRRMVEDQLMAVAAGFDNAPKRVRLALDQRGEVMIDIEDLVDERRPVRVAVDNVPVDPTDWRLFHKTSMRSRYQHTRRRHPEADDVLMVNNRGEITESTIANVIVRVGDRWLTPPLASGCLPGVMRRVLLERGEISEAPVSVSDLARADSVELINSVRGRMPVMLAPAADVVGKAPQ
jgi:para-aminobenzoate synthetase/4-amino-4-deoxychorismate lyase